MYKLCKTEASAQRQRQLEMGLLDAMEAHHYDEISIHDLCERMQVPRKAFYRYFSGKEGALHALLDHTFLEYEKISTGFLGVNPEGAKRELETFFAFWLSQRRLLDALEKSNLSGTLLERSIIYAVNQHGGPVSVYPLSDAFLHSQAVTFLTSGLISMVLRWHHGGYTHTPREMAETAAKILSRPIIP